MTPNNALERTGKHRGPRLAAARRSWSAAQLGSLGNARMSAAKHIRLLFQSIIIWLAFWLLGLPSYYQQYSGPALGIACTVLSVVICLAALRILLRSRTENRAARAFWCSVYYTATFAILDTLYCGIYLGHGAQYIVQYWYLTVFYVTPWLTFVPIERLLRNRVVAA